jgi:perosamine synthetase
MKETGMPSGRIAEIVQAIRQVVGTGPAVLHEPWFAGKEGQYLQECLNSTFVSSVGEFVTRFEHDIAKYTGAKHAVAVVNGTAALHAALRLAGVQHGDEVFVPALTFVATANAVAYCGAVPHFVDANELTLGIDVEALRNYLENFTEMRDGHCFNPGTGRILRAVVPMHTFGHPTDMVALLGLAETFRLVVVEDAAESLGSCIGGRHTGTFGQMGVLSFNGNKIITTGGGGAILMNDSDLYRRTKHLTTTAKIPHRWSYYHDEIGFNYRLPNLNAALGCAQIEQLPKFVAAKRQLYRRYEQAIRGIAGIRLIREPAGTQSNYWLQGLMLDEAESGARDAILTATNDAGLMTRPAWDLLHNLPPYRDCPRQPLLVAESIARRLINIPSSARLGGADKG